MSTKTDLMKAYYRGGFSDVFRGQRKKPWHEMG